jgi:heme-degrading monooxygenase HmoA
MGVILKDFRCRVLDGRMGAFSTEQERWSSLRAEPGFVAQCGGAEASDALAVQIFGVWDGLEAYQRFMSGTHDRIFEAGEQGACYADAESTVYERVLEMFGVSDDLAGSLKHGAAMIRIARCDVLPDRVEHFVEMQRTLWRAGMRDAPGMLGGNFWQAVDDEHRFIVTTAWASIQDHERYRHERLDGLKAKTKPRDDLVSIEGAAVVLDPVWTVLG